MRRDQSKSGNLRRDDGTTRSLTARFRADQKPATAETAHIAEGSVRI
jgi:hypothetical protein